MGVCYGLTTPSVSGVEVVGDANEDAALNVHFDSEAITDAWFSPALVSLVDHAAGSHAATGSHSFVKSADGEWVEETIGRPRLAPE